VKEKPPVKHMHIDSTPSPWVKCWYLCTTSLCTTIHFWVLYMLSFVIAKYRSSRLGNVYICYASSVSLAATKSWQNLAHNKGCSLISFSMILMFAMLLGKYSSGCIRYVGLTGGRSININININSNINILIIIILIY
jgi:hypothetical protein